MTRANSAVESISSIPIKNYTTPFFEETDVTVQMYGPPYHWGLRGIPEDRKEWRPEHKQTVQGLMCVLNSSDARRMYAPNPSTFNRRIAGRGEFNHFLRNETGDREILLGAMADGVEIKRGEAVLIASADCPTTVLWDKHGNRVLVLHTGRECLINLKDENFNPKDSIIFEAVKAMGGRAPYLRAFITCGIKACHFSHPLDHPRYGAKNRLLIETVRKCWGDRCIEGDPQEGCLSLSELIRSQLEHAGVNPQNIHTDGFDTFSDKDEDNSPRWHSYRRDRTNYRNGVVVFHHPDVSI